jgi:nucleoside-triphosphatase THEP1
MEADLGWPAMAAVVYEPGEGRAVDALLSALAVELKGAGLVLAGTVQRAAARADRCACDMIVTDLASGTDRSISEDRGPMARGCRLDTAALEALAGATLSALDRGADLLLVNKFGKREAEGAGFRSALGAAVGAGTPVLVAVNRDFIGAWREFAGGMATELPPDLAAVRRWAAPLLAPTDRLARVD